MTTEGVRSDARPPASAMIDTPGLPWNGAVDATDGSTMTTGESTPAGPRWSPPDRRAPPILPQPTSRTGADRPVMTETASLGFADGIEAGGGHGLGGVLAAPHHVLEGRIEALALVERHVDEILELLDRGTSRAAQ